MNKLVVTLLVSFPAAATAVDTPPVFSAPSIELPSSSLVGDAKQRLPPFVGGIQLGMGPSSTSAIRMSRMPIIVPTGQIDPKMLKAPDDSIDYKLIIKSPEVAPDK